MFRSVLGDQHHLAVPTKNCRERIPAATRERHPRAMPRTNDNAALHSAKPQRSASMRASRWEDVQLPVHALDEKFIFADGQDVVFVDGKRQRHGFSLVFLGSTPGSTESSWSYRRLSYADMSNILGIGEGHGDIIFIIVGFIR
jgi:hypothetical protein